MIHYHGGPITPNPTGLAVWKGRHAMISFADSRQISLAAEVCQSFTIDNGALSTWKGGDKFNTRKYYDFVAQWSVYPGCDWSLIPDVIDGTEAQNDKLVRETRAALPEIEWVPVWHLHESVARLRMLAGEWRRVAFGSSGDYSDPGSPLWWNRMAEAMEAVCDDEGRPRTKLHGLRMMDPTIFSHIPFASVDSTNVARNVSLNTRWNGSYQPMTESVRGLVLVDRIESHACAQRWSGTGGIQKNLELVG